MIALAEVSVDMTYVITSGDWRCEVDAGSHDEAIQEAIKNVPPRGVSLGQALRVQVQGVYGSSRYLWTENLFR